MVKKQDTISQAPGSGSNIQKSEATGSNGALKPVKTAQPTELSNGEGKKNSNASSAMLEVAANDTVDLDVVSDTNSLLSLPSRTDTFKADTKPSLTPKPAAIDLSLEEEKRRRRAERFGTAATSITPPKAVTSKPLSVEEELEKRRKRAERFNGGNATTSTTPTPNIGKNLAPSLKALSTLDEKEKLRLRAERFGIVNPSNSLKRKASVKEKPINGTPNPGPTALTEEEKQKLEARAKRFKLNTSATSSSTSALSPEDDEKLAKRAVRFGINKP